MNIYDNETKTIDFSIIEASMEFINKHFLPYVLLIEKRDVSFLDEVAKLPMARFDDYKFHFDEELFHLFNREDLLAEFHTNVKRYKDEFAENDKVRFKKYLLQVFDKNKLLKNFNTQELQKQNLLYSFWNGIPEEEKAEFVKGYIQYTLNKIDYLSKQTIKDEFDWLTDYYCVLGGMKDYISDVKLKEQASDIITKYYESMM